MVRVRRMGTRRGIGSSFPSNVTSHDRGEIMSKKNASKKVKKKIKLSFEDVASGDLDKSVREHLNLPEREDKRAQLFNEAELAE